MTRLLHNMRVVVGLFLVLASFDLHAQEQKQIENDAYIIKQHSFEVTFKNTGKVRFVSYHNVKNSPPKIDFFLVDHSNRILHTFPTYYGNEHWTFHGIKAVSFKDINNDSLKDILIITEHITGIGPSGTDPFDVAGFYIQGEKGFKRHKELEEMVNSDALYGQWKSISDLAALAASYQKSRTQ